MWVQTDDDRLINLDYIREVDISGKVLRALPMEPAGSDGGGTPLGTFDSKTAAQEALGELSVAIDKGDRVFAGFLPPDEQ